MVDQACPVCMGYDFALVDKGRLKELDPLESRLYRHKSNTEKSSLSEAKLQELKEEALSVKKERYEAINSRKEEMGLDPEDVDKLLQEFREAYFDD
jgi:DNA repair exonuclease SbcCD ATPase subunit